MGFFDRFKKKEEAIKPTPSYYEPPKSTDIRMTEQGRKVIECFDKSKGAILGYDTVTLIMDKAPRIIGGKSVYTCQVKWTRSGDTVIFADIDNPATYTQALAEIDVHQLETDPNYLQSVVWELFKRERVNKYLNRSMMTEEEISQKAAQTGDRMMVPCGKYIGFIDSTSYGKKFNQTVGMAAHRLPEMETERTTKREEAARRARNNAVVHSKMIEYEKAQLMATPELASLFPDKYMKLGLIDQSGNFLFDMNEIER